MSCVRLFATKLTFLDDSLCHGVDVPQPSRDHRGNKLFQDVQDELLLAIVGAAVVGHEDERDLGAAASILVKVLHEGIQDWLRGTCGDDHRLAVV